MVKSYLDKYFNRLNKEVYEQKGMEWYIVPNHYWLELRIISARTNTSQNIDSNNNSIKFGEITKNDRSPMVSSKFGPMQEEVNLNKENINQEPLQFYENNKNEEEYDIERDGVYHEESMNEDESRPMNTDYMNPNDVKQIFQNDFNNFHEDLSKDAIEMHHEGIYFLIFCLIYKITNFFSSYK